MRRDMKSGCESIDLDRWENEGGRCRNDLRSSAEVSSNLFNQENESLHRALVGMSRGLLQYASQCQLWSPTNDRHRSTIFNRLASQQQESIQTLSELLEERQYPISWGVFPAAYTRFNYVALDYLWPRIAAFQARLVRMLDAVRKEVEHDRLTTDVLDDVIQSELEILAELEQASPPHNSRHPFPRTRTGSRNAGNTSLVGNRRIRDWRSDLLAVSYSSDQDAKRIDHTATVAVTGRDSRRHTRN